MLSFVRKNNFTTHRDHGVLTKGRFFLIALFSFPHLHSVVIRGIDGHRTVLVVDVYHPDLTLAERSYLEELEELHRSYFPATAAEAPP